MSSVQKALQANRSKRSNLENQITSGEKAFIDIASSGSYQQLKSFSSRGIDRRNYSLFRGWMYSAVHALASEGSSQPVKMAEVSGPNNQFRKLDHQTKSPNQDMGIIIDDPFLSALENPNPAQYRWQFVYNFIVNINLTGWGYIIGGETEEGFEFYSVPTDWVTPLHQEGPFSNFKIQNPRDPESKTQILTKENVGFAYFPNPSDPLCGIAPVDAQLMGIKIDDHIQSSQEAFFENGIFPSVVVTVGRDPHPDVPGGLRPRLTAEQRREVIGAIRKVSGGVANYGNPAIVDGLIEKIERLSATSNEMGWERSETSARTRILSAFGVHPYILGEATNVGGHAQTFNIEKRFCKRVNTFLDMLSVLMTEFNNQFDTGTKKKIWWEPCTPIDKSIQSVEMREARRNNDITQNEYRTYLGLTPDSDRPQQYIDKSMIQSVGNLLINMNKGLILRDQFISILKGLGIPAELADEIADDPELIEVPQDSGGAGQLQDGQDGESPEELPDDEPQNLTR